MSSSKSTYTHRFNSDGTIDSICHTCFRTIGKVSHEADLEPIERGHQCDPLDLTRIASDASGWFIP